MCCGLLAVHHPAGPPTPGRRGRHRRDPDPSRRPCPPTPSTRCSRSMGIPDYFFHTEWPTTSPTAGSPSMRLTFANAAAPAGTARRPHFTTDLACYDTELERALSVIGQDSRSAKVWLRAIPARVGSSCRCGWIGCADAARPRAWVSPAGSEQPVSGPAGPGGSAPRRDLGRDRRGIPNALQGSGPQAG